METWISHYLFRNNDFQIYQFQQDFLHDILPAPKIDENVPASHCGLCGDQTTYSAPCSKARINIILTLNDE